jgi:hemerythrin
MIEMPLVTWNDNLSVGVKVLDDDHKRLVGMINELHDGIMLGRARDVLGSVLDGLVKYTETHFAREEHFFAQTGYRGRAAHKREHQNLTKRVKDLQAHYSSGEPLALSLETIDFLKTWLVTHIQGSDKKYGPHLNAKGIR